MRKREDCQGDQRRPGQPSWIQRGFLEKGALNRVYAAAQLKSVSELWLSVNDNDFRIRLIGRF